MIMKAYQFHNQLAKMLQTVTKNQNLKIYFVKRMFLEADRAAELQFLFITDPLIFYELVLES